MCVHANAAAMCCKLLWLRKGVKSIPFSEMQRCKEVVVVVVVMVFFAVVLPLQCQGIE